MQGLDGVVNEPQIGTQGRVGLVGDPRIVRVESPGY